MRWLLVGVGVVTVSLGARSQPAPDQLPQSYSNLQVLNKNVSSEELIGLMRAIAIGLGTRCEHCHVGAGNDLSKFDFASDAKPEKGVARTMLRLVTVVNRDLLKGVGDPKTSVKVTCYTCHRGALKPLTAPPTGPGRP